MTNFTAFMRRLGLALVLVFLALVGQAQELFPEKVEGTWEGTMQMYRHGQLADSVKVEFEVKPLAEADSWMWEMRYVTEQGVQKKPYKLRVVDAVHGRYVTDEGGGLLLTDYQFGNKLYSVFEVKGTYLTASYELVNEYLVFEVTSGKPLEPAAGVNRFSVDFLQRAVMKRRKNP